MKASDARRLALEARLKGFEREMGDVYYAIQLAAKNGEARVDVRVKPGSLANIQTSLEANGYKVTVMQKAADSESGLVLLRILFWDPDQRA